ncbi:small ribosomal subunit protein uS8 isoform X7 [Bubalus kerabau]|uniref:small ribosomal subunit protein uS8 isoform X7 n=1 Tax=Bubalus carabanensis TaxID=3119969 RepID=UPI00244EE7AA|nr:40S ribosomal protein S15a isoform X7 [Bubalus carabanensis]
MQGILCGVISPRFDVQLKDLEKWQNNLLPSRQFGGECRICKGSSDLQNGAGSHEPSRKPKLVHMERPHGEAPGGVLDNNPAEFLADSQHQPPDRVLQWAYHMDVVMPTFRNS